MLADLLQAWPIAIVAILFAMGRELMEHSMDSKWDKPHSTWWNRRVSWKNKHEWQPSWLFKTALVWMTDAEHFFQMVMNMSALVGVALAAGLPVSIPAAAIAFFIGNAVFGIIKETLLPNVQ